MAQMIPHAMEEDNNSFGERQAFEALKKLPIHPKCWRKYLNYQEIIKSFCEILI